MKLILHLYSCSEGCGASDFYYSFEEESKEKAEYDLYELCAKLKDERNEFYQKSDELHQKRPVNNNEKRNQQWMAEYTKFLQNNEYPGYSIVYKNHEIDLSLFYDNDKFEDLTILTPEEFYERNLP